MKKIYIIPTAEILDVDSYELMTASQLDDDEVFKPNPLDREDPWTGGRAKGTGSFDDFSDDDEDGLFYKKYTVKW